MFATLLVIYPWLAPVVLATCIVLSPAIGRWLLPRHRLAVWLLSAYCGVLLAIVFLPSGRTTDVSCMIEWTLPLPSAPEPFANVVLFVPLAYLMALLLRRPLVAAAAAIAISVAIEMTQALIPVLGRSCSTNDLLANSIGAILGAALARGALQTQQREGGPRLRSRGGSPQ
ncbi:hypothetical protein ACI1US_02368 [Leucobacter sp. BZR 635]